jgi:ribose transport system substrate-binding protein
LCATTVIDGLPHGGDVVVLAADLDQPEVAERIEGFKSTIRVRAAQGDAAESRLRIVAYLTDGDDPTQRLQNILRVLNDHPRLACIADMSSRPSELAVEALAGAQRAGDVKVVTFDESDEALDAIKRGEVYAAITRDAYQIGYQSVCSVLDLTRRSPLEQPAAGQGRVNVRCRVVRQDNVGEFLGRPIATTVAQWGG